jgi:hypothetical protein
VLCSCRTSPCSSFSPSASHVMLMSKFSLFFIFAKRVTCSAHVEILPVLLLSNLKLARRVKATASVLPSKTRIRTISAKADCGHYTVLRGTVHVIWTLAHLVFPSA